MCEKTIRDLQIVARAKDIFHVFEFYKLHVKIVQREMFNSATELGVKVLSTTWLYEIRSIQGRTYLQTP